MSSIASGSKYGHSSPEEVLKYLEVFWLLQRWRKRALLAFNEQGPGMSAIPLCSGQYAHLRIVQITT